MLIDFLFIYELETYQSNEYFSYNEYTYNDLFIEMEKYRNPQPKVK